MTDVSLPLEADRIAELIRALGVDLAVDPDQADSPQQLVVSLALGLVGAAERHAITAEQSGRAAGMSFDDIGDCTSESFGAAGCRSDLDAWRLMEWRAVRLTQALKHVDGTGPRGTTDPLVHAVTLTAAALAGMLTAVATMRDPMRPAGENAAAARGLRAAVRALAEATEDATRTATVAADLLNLVD